MALDPSKYFIIIPNMFGNGLSSSPSNTPEPYTAPRFPQRDRLRQRPRAAPAGDREVRHRAHPTGHRLFDGRDADLPLGRAVSGHGGAHRALLRLGELLAPQLRLSRRSQSGPDRGRRVRRTAGTRRSRQRPACRGAGLRRLGFLAGVLSRRTRYEDAGLFLAGGFYGRRSGRACSCPRTPTTC